LTGKLNKMFKKLYFYSIYGPNVTITMLFIF
jgi:hypothetical protein